MTERLIFCCIILALLLGGTTVYRGYIVKTTETRVTKELVAKYDAEYATKLQEALKVERDLLTAKIESEKRKNEKAEKDNSRLSALVDSLRNRATRESKGGNSKSAPSCGPSTGSGLYRDDSEFLSRLAAEAERVKRERDYYYELYENARSKIEELKGKK